MLNKGEGSYIFSSGKWRSVNTPRYIMLSSDNKVSQSRKTFLGGGNSMAKWDQLSKRKIPTQYKYSYQSLFD